jgi:hypothetical protein
MMAASTAMVLAAGGMAFADSGVNKSNWDIRIPVATGAVALITAGAESINPQLGKGIATIIVLGVFLTSGVRLIQFVSTGKKVK